MSEEQKKKVQTQFGGTSDDYAKSEVHAKGETLSILLELLEPQADWHVLDVATGAGHTALSFAPYVAQVMATDITTDMTNKAAQLATERGITNFDVKYADAEELPFDDHSFDLVTCRIAMHHFPNPRQAIAEFARVVKPGGKIGLTDNVTVPDKQAAGYYNAYEKLRDPSHNWVSPLSHLVAMFEDAGLTVETTRQVNKEMEFHNWADRMRVSEDNKEKLLDMMRNIPEALQPLFQPRWTDETMYFSVREAVIIAQASKRP